MSIASRLNDRYVPLAVACEQAGYPTDRLGQRNLRRQLRKKGFPVRRVGNAFSVTVGDFHAYIAACEKANAAHRAKISAMNHVRWAAKHAAG